MKKTSIAVSVLVLIALGYTWGQDYFTLSYLKMQLSVLQAWVQVHYASSFVVYFLLYVLVTALSIPGATVLTLGAGALFGPVVGLVLASFASAFGALVAFSLVRYLFRDSVQRRYAQELAGINEGVRQEGWIYLLSLRLIPIFPFFLVNILMALTPIRAIIFYGVSQLAMLPATSLYVWAGQTITQIDSLQGILSPSMVLLLVALGLLPILGKVLVLCFRRWAFLKKHPRPKHYDYNLIVIGGGSAGLVSALIANALKAKVLLVEKHQMGGDCLNTGCVPSKALLKSAKVARLIQKAEQFGIYASQSIRFENVMQKVHAAIATIEPNDSMERFQSLGVDCVSGHAKLLSPYEVDIDGKIHTARKIIVATGARPRRLDIPGIEQASLYTSDTIWQLETLPERLLVIGGGPIGVELSQAMARLGAKVTLITQAERLLPHEDEEASALIHQCLQEEGIRIITQTKPEKCIDAHHVLLTGVVSTTVSFDAMLCAIGREANTDDLGLEALEVAQHDNGMIKTNQYLQTNIPTIYACGDVCGPYQLTHASSHQAYIATVNALFGSMFWRAKMGGQAMPHCTYSEPEVAAIGLNEKTAKEQGISYEVTQMPMGEVDRAIAEQATCGWIKVLTTPGTDRILGATVVGEHAGELVAELALAMRHKLGLKKILGTIHAYPTWMEANLKVAGKWQKNNQPRRILALLDWWHQRLRS